MQVIGNAVLNLREFLPKQISFLQGFENQDILDIAGYFDAKIRRAREELQFAERKLVSVSENSDSVSDPYKGEGGRDEQERAMARMEIVRFNKKLTCLVNRKKDFLADPVEYQKCEECGKKIPKERLEEVPHCRHCVKCKNNIHNGNNCH